MGCGWPWGEQEKVHGSRAVRLRVPVQGRRILALDYIEVSSLALPGGRRSGQEAVLGLISGKDPCDPP